MSGITIRPERPGDEATIHRLTEAAFRDMPFSEGDEQHLVDALRRHVFAATKLHADDTPLPMTLLSVTTETRMTD